MPEEICPRCGSTAELVKMGDEEVLRCTKCGYEAKIRAEEEILPIEKKLVAVSIVLAVILLAILYYVSWSMIAHLTP
ncbi:hypothetical protein [Archaeoglobus sp.]